MKLNDFLQRLNDAPDSLAFNDTIALIEAQYDFTPTTFKNGGLLNEAGKTPARANCFRLPSYKACRHSKPCIASARITATMCSNTRTARITRPSEIL